ncbi:MAG: STAS domain-containing protein [Anaerolineales bacterium]|nr:STAS domain-containing protein [Anaerolineales bacterium]
MEITVSQHQGAVPVTVLTLLGALDGASFESLIDKAEEVYAAGTRALLLDLGRLTFMSSAGISAVHSVALLLRGKGRPDLEQGWASFRAIDRERDGNAKDPHVKLLNPPEKVLRTLEMVGFTAIFEVFTDLNEALASFG